MAKNGIIWLIRGFFMAPEDLPPRCGYFYVFSIYAYLAAFLLNVIFALALLALKINFLSYSCAGAALMFFLAMALNRRGRLIGAFAAAYVGQMAHAGFSVYISSSAGFHYYLIPLMVVSVLFPYEKKYHRLIFGGLVSIEYILLNHFAPMTSPVFPGNPKIISILSFINVYISLCVMSFAAVYYGFSTERAREALENDGAMSKALLHNVLPVKIAERLKNSTDSITEEFRSVTIIFSDIVGFSAISKEMAPEEMVGFLNSVFSKFDDLADKHGLEKIKTIGDAYMCVGGIPVEREGHAAAGALMAIDMMEAFSALAAEQGESFRLRIGINSGSVVAGIIGKKKYSYDLWGDAVNTASRMASHGRPGEIQMTHATYELIKDDFIIEPRGKVKVKGMGAMRTYLLKAPKLS